MDHVASFVFNEQTITFGADYVIRLHSGWETVGTIDSLVDDTLRVVLQPVTIGHVYQRAIETVIPLQDVEQMQLVYTLDCPTRK